MAKELNIALFRRGRNADGEDGYWRVGYDFVLPEFGGVLPQKGDVIVPYLGIQKPEDYTLYVVEERFFRPPGSEHQFINVGLVVTERRGASHEGHLLMGGG
jgi:hypothetical protein